MFDLFSVITLNEAVEVIRERFARIDGRESVPLSKALGRTAAVDIESGEYIPGFSRSTVDGYAVRASDTFGCSDSIPAMLDLVGAVEMGESACDIGRGQCAYVPTGGELPEGADAVVMIEYAEESGGTVFASKPAAPGENVVMKGDDAIPGDVVVCAGRVIGPRDAGALAAVGCSDVPVVRRPIVGVISTGDELVRVNETPGVGQVRDVNSATILAFVETRGADGRDMGFVRDDEAELRRVLDEALATCDAVIVSGGSSVGMKDATRGAIEERGEMLFHGLALKPGKPTMLGVSSGKAVIGLPGHPGAAYLVAVHLVGALIDALMGRETTARTRRAVLSETLGANHGREQLTAVHLFERDGELCAKPLHSTSGLIMTLASSDGYISIPRDSEGASAGESVLVYEY